MRKKYPPKPGAKPRTFFSSFLRGPAVPHRRDGRRRRPRPDPDRGRGATAFARSDDGTWRVTLSTGEVLDGDAVDRRDRGLGRRAARPRRRRRRSPTCSRRSRARRRRRSRWRSTSRGLPVRQELARHPVAGGREAAADWPSRSVVEVAGPRARKAACCCAGSSAGRATRRSRGERRRAHRDRRAAQFVELLGVKPDAQAGVRRACSAGSGGMPQYTLGHLDRVDHIEALSARIPGSRARRRRVPRGGRAQLHRERRGRGDQGAR